MNAEHRHARLEEARRREEADQRQKAAAEARTREIDSVYGENVDKTEKEAERRLRFAERRAVARRVTQPERAAVRSGEEARRVGEINNYETRKPVLLEFGF
jgi:hypothetical protein